MYILYRLIFYLGISDKERTYPPLTNVVTTPLTIFVTLLDEFKLFPSNLHSTFGFLAHYLVVAEADTRRV